MGFLPQITTSCLRALSKQVAGAGGRWKQGAVAGCRCRVLVRAVVLGELAARVVETRCRCWVLAVRMVETAGAGAAVARRARCWCPLLTVK